MHRNLFNDLDISSYQKMRAMIATFNNAALLCRSWREDMAVDKVAELAVSSANELLDQLGIVDPDKELA